MEYTYDANGLRKTEIRQGDDLRLKVTTTFDRSNNVFGLINETKLDWVDPLTAMPVVRVAERTVYQPNGRFPQTSTNAVGHVTTRAFDARTGAPSSMTTPNGLTVTWTADGFGRTTGETGVNGNESRSSVRQCIANCPAGASSVLVRETLRGGVRIAVPVLSYQDSAGRVMRTESWGFDGRKVVTVNRYDAQGRLWETDWPRFEADDATLATRNEYDDLNRVVSVSTLNELGAVQSTRTEYRKHPAEPPSKS